jgi:hypothetical protein
MIKHAQRIRWDELPLFASDHELGRALLGDRANEFAGLAVVLERDGFPTVDDRMGGRYVPAVKAYFDRDYGLATLAPRHPGGTERPDLWNTKKQKT